MAVRDTSSTGDLPMTHSKFAPVGLALILLAALAAPAQAQMPTGLDALVARQGQLDTVGRMMAQLGGLRAFALMQQYRALTGFRGAFPSFVTPLQQMQSAAALNNAYAAARQSGAQSSASRAQSAENYANHGILGQQTMVNPSTGQTYSFVPNSVSNWFSTNHGLVGTNSEMYQPYGGTRLVPMQ